MAKSGKSETISLRSKACDLKDCTIAKYKPSERVPLPRGKDNRISMALCEHPEVWNDLPRYSIPSTPAEFDCEATWRALKTRIAAIRLELEGRALDVSATKTVSGGVTIQSLDNLVKQMIETAKSEGLSAESALAELRGMARVHGHAAKFADNSEAILAAIKAALE